MRLYSTLHYGLHIAGEIQDVKIVDDVLFVPVLIKYLLEIAPENTPLNTIDEIADYMIWDANKFAVWINQQASQHSQNWTDASVIFAANNLRKIVPVTADQVIADALFLVPEENRETVEKKFRSVLEVNEERIRDVTRIMKMLVERERANG